MELRCSLPCLQQPATDPHPDHTKQYTHKHTSIKFSKSMQIWLSLNFLTLSTLNRTKIVTFLFKIHPQKADGIAHSTHLSIYLSDFLTAVAVFRKPNAIPLCFSIDLVLNFLLSWLLVLLPSMFFLDVLFSFSPVVSNP